MIIISSHDEFAQLLNKEIGTSGWHKISQEQINQFADATLDHQWIHVNAARAAVESPFKATIAHGYLTLSLIPFLWKQIADVRNIKMEINYGIESFKFSQPAVVNSEIRLRVKLAEIVNLRGITKVNMSLTMEIKDSDKPAFVGNTIFLYHFIT